MFSCLVAQVQAGLISPTPHTRNASSVLMLVVSCLTRELPGYLSKAKVCVKQHHFSQLKKKRPKRGNTTVSHLQASFSARVIVPCKCLLLPTDCKGRPGNYLCCRCLHPVRVQSRPRRTWVRSL